MAKSLKELIREEYIKCAKDPVYFFKKYCYIQHPHRGKILFNLLKIYSLKLNFDSSIKGMIFLDMR